MPRMDAEQARRRFTAARVARLATVDPAGRPRLVPVVFAAYGPEALDGTGAPDGIPYGPDAPRGADAAPYGLVTAVDHKPKRTTRLARLADIEATPAVCLLVDSYDEDWDRLWWARADGTARIVPPDAPDPAVRARHSAALARLRDKYPQYRAALPGGPVVDIAVHRWSGWRATPPPAAPPAGPPG
ncbi:TIGR03668 family PPOX class F420-dependent oxidoreductase [Streptomyces sp. SID8499]|uniref:TIGR03668 family PPOX class F420-dependent oxidoreductase n=1 Tax=Streptomyces sp. SID8499 TaxID=2706106 RepID=UPI0031BA3AB9